MSGSPLRLGNTATQYGLVARVLHWTSVGLMLAVILAASRFDGMGTNPGRPELVANHYSLGTVLLLVMAARLAWRRRNPNPVASYSIGRLHKAAAVALHRGIYVVVLGQCLVGLVMLAVMGEPVRLFGAAAFGPLLPEQASVVEGAKAIHHALSVAIYPLFAVHIAAAIHHQIFGVVETPSPTDPSGK